MDPSLAIHVCSNLGYLWLVLGGAKLRRRRADMVKMVTIYLKIVMGSRSAVQRWLRWQYFYNYGELNIFPTHNQSCTTPVMQGRNLYLHINLNSDAHSTKIYGSMSAVLTSAWYLLIYLADVLPPLQGIFISPLKLVKYIPG